MTILSSPWHPTGSWQDSRMLEHASPFKYLGDALYLRNQLVRMLEEAEANLTLP